MDKKNLTIIGSTGSIGTQTLQVLDEFPEAYRVKGLSCDSNIDLLEKQVKTYRPERVCVMNPEKALAFEKRVPDIEVLTGLDGLISVASDTDNDLLLTAVSGMIGLEPTLHAIENNIDIALANKETLVAGGALVTEVAKRHGVKILPVDSEHSAVFQCLYGNAREEIDKIILTASGGPFRGYTKEQLRAVTPAQALKHPNWHMGAKITIDSSTMMNKGFEVIEARWLFDVNPEQIDVLVHPQSIIHSMVAYRDHAVIAQLGLPDMRLPIQLALFYPHRLPNAQPPLDLAQIGSLTFEKPDSAAFSCLELAYEALRAGGTVPAALNAANEETVAAFLQGKIAYPDIAAINERVMTRVPSVSHPTLQRILETDAAAREAARSLIKAQ